MVRELDPLVDETPVVELVVEAVDVEVEAILEEEMPEIE